MILRLLVYSYYQIVGYGCLAANEHVWSELQKIDQHEKMWSFAILAVAVVGLAAVWNICLVVHAADVASASALLCALSVLRILRRSASARD